MSYYLRSQVSVAFFLLHVHFDVYSMMSSFLCD